MRPPPIDCCVFCEFPAATSHAQTSPPLARCPTMSHNPGTSSTSRSLRLVVVLLVAQQCYPALKTKNRHPALSSTKRARPRLAYRPLLPLAAVGHGAAGFRRRQGRGGGASGHVASFSFWQCGRSLWCCRFPVLPFAFVRGLSTCQFLTKAVSHRDPRFGCYRVIL